MMFPKNGVKLILKIKNQQMTKTHEKYPACKVFDIPLYVGSDFIVTVTLMNMSLFAYFSVFNSIPITNNMSQFFTLCIIDYIF